MVRRKDRLLAVLLTILLIFSQVNIVGAEGSNDINGHWAQPQIEKWIQQGLITGYNDGTFQPDRNISRAEFVALINRAFNINEAGTKCSFTDVKSDDWFYQHVVSAYASGYISGYPDGTFRPNESISRQEAAVIIARFLNLRASSQEALKVFNDFESIPAWASESINAVVENKVIKGYPDGTFKGNTPISRAEAVVILDRALTIDSALEGISGKVTMDGQPVVGASIKLYDKVNYEPIKEMKTDENGRYEFVLPIGIYDITASKGKNIGYAVDISVVKNIVTTQDITMAQGVRVSGKVLDKYGRRIPNLKLYFGDSPVFSAATGIYGEFTVYLPAGLNFSVYCYEPGNDKGNLVKIGSEFTVNNTDMDLGSLETNFETAYTVIGNRGGSSNSDSSNSDTTPPSIVITIPTEENNYIADSPTITLGGTASDNKSVSSVSYSVYQSVGESVYQTVYGTATGTLEWLIPSLQLYEGENLVTVTAADSSGNTASDTISIIYVVPDTVPPVVTIMQPTEDSEYTTDEIIIDLSGSASDNESVQSVVYCVYQVEEESISEAVYGIATGTNEWLISNLALQPGINIITVTALDASGNTSSDSITVNCCIEVGYLAGLLKDAVMNTPVSGARLSIYGSGGEVVAETTSLEDGSFSLDVLPGSEYRLYINADGYIDEDYYNISITGGNTTYLETVYLVHGEYYGIGCIEGAIYNALSGAGVSGLTINLRRGINVKTGEILSSTETGEGGAYSFTGIPAGNYTAEIMGEGYVTSYFTVISIGGETRGNQNATATPLLEAGEIRIVLTWGESPEDLDSHLTGPTADGEGRFHVYYGDEDYQESETLYAALDHDDTTSYGPETTTIYHRTEGVYRFSVKHYGGEIGSTELSYSGAKVEVYNGSTLIAVFNVPTNKQGIYWTVFDLSGDTITPINTVTNESYYDISTDD